MGRGDGIATERRRLPGWVMVAVGGFAVLLATSPGMAQSADCAALKARIEAGRSGADPGRLALAIRQNREEIARIEAYAADSGCTGGGSPFDDPDPPECQALARRAGDLRRTVERLTAAAAQDGDEDRRVAMEDYAAVCGDGSAPPTPDAVIPVDPDAPGVPADTPAPATGHVAKVFCVRRCDGAYYPLAVDVPTTSLEDLNRLCAAQCPNADAVAFTGPGDDIADAHALDGAAYPALSTAFAFQKKVSPTCSCRAPGASWAQTLAKAETMIEAHKGDVVVTPEVQARMLLPQAAPEAPKSPAARPAAKRVAAPPRKTPSAADAEAADRNADVMRELRRSVPTL